MRIEFSGLVGKICFFENAYADDTDAYLANIQDLGA